MERRPSKRVTFGSALALLLVAGALIAAAVGVTTYFELVQLHLDVGDATARMESSARERAELAANLLRAAPHLARVDRGRLDAVAPLVEQARGDVLGDEAASSPGRLAEYVERQHELSRRLDELWGTVERPVSPAAREELDELRAKLERSESELRRSLDRLAASLGSYERAAGAFPGSVIAGVRFEGRPLRRTAARGDAP